MKKYILKVALITIVAIILVFALVLLGLKIFAPKTVADYYDKIGEPKHAMLYAEQAYLKEENFDNLLKLSNFSIKAEKDEYVVKYTKKLIEHENFIDYCNNIESGIAFYDYCAASYIKSLYNSDESIEDSALIETAFTYSQDYRKGNSFSSLLHAAADKNDATLLTLALDKLNAFKLSGNCPEEAKSRLDSDISAVNSILSK